MIYNSRTLGSRKCDMLNLHLTIPVAMNSLVSHDSTSSQLLIARIVPKSFIDIVAALIIVVSLIAYLCAGYTWNRPNALAYKWYERPQAADAVSKFATTRTRDIAKRLDGLVTKTLEIME